MHSKRELQFDEAERLRAVRTSGLLDRSAGRDIEDVVQLAAALTAWPMAAVTVVDDDVVHYLAVTGVGHGRLPRKGSFCDVTIHTIGPLVVEDAVTDERFRSHPLVAGTPPVRAYAGVPVHVGHLPVGAMCLYDTAPRPAADADLELLRVLGRQVDRLVELHWRRGLSTPPSPETVGRLAESIRAAEDFDVLVGDLAHPAWVYDCDTFEFLRVNDAAVQHYGWTAEEFARMTVLDVRPTEDAEQFRASLANSELLRDSLNDESMLAFWNNRRFLHHRRGGEVFEVRLSWAELVFEGRHARLAIVTDVSASERLEAAVDYAATHDPLTGLGNRRLLHATLESLLGTDTPLSLAVIDLDHFKTVNDAAGHRLGDELLVSVAARLSPLLPPEATAMRYGGDEFAVVLPRADAAGALAWSERARDAIARPFHLGLGEFRVTASAGTAASERDMSPAELLARADDAILDAKRSGRNRVVVADEASRLWHRERSRIAQDLAAAEDRGELELHYQPILSIDGSGAGVVDRVEALLRWRRDRRAVLAPAQFLEVAEETGLIVPLGRWVIDEACAAIARWAAAGRDMRVSVNCSSAQLTPDLVPQVDAALERHGITGDRLAVELREGALTDDPDVADDVIQQLRRRQVDVVIDGFGAGYSSMGQLQDLAVSGLKIDRSFTLALATTQGQGLCRAIVEVAEALHLDVTAVGVETPRQLSAMAGLGCGYAQGFLLGRAAPEHIVPEHPAFPVGEHASPRRRLR